MVLASVLLWRASISAMSPSSTLASLNASRYAAMLSHMDFPTCEDVGVRMDLGLRLSFSVFQGLMVSGSGFGDQDFFSGAGCGVKVLIVRAPGGCISVSASSLTQLRILTSHDHVVT
eukprot:2830523-Rhodomonas_salina.3